MMSKSQQRTVLYCPELQYNHHKTKLMLYTIAIVGYTICYLEFIQPNLEA